jgi:hypothetical protein
MTRRLSSTAPELLRAIVQRLDRGGSPDSHFPNREGEYWALCPFHPDKHPRDFSVSVSGYHCFACGASGGLGALAQKTGSFPPNPQVPAESEVTAPLCEEGWADDPDNGRILEDEPPW